VWHLQATTPFPPPDWLTPAEAELFRRMAPADQLEGLAVARQLTGWGYGADRDLLVAGLLHDVGKSLASRGVLLRTTATLIAALTPWLAWALYRRGGALGMLFRHPATGAQLAAQAGLPPRVIELIRDHHAPPFDARMAALQLADSLH
jgi:putative nucleotidyltransferase with HDIG domain